MMKWLRRLLIPILIVLLGCSFFVVVVVPNVFGLTLNRNFLSGIVRGLLSRDTGENISVSPGFVVSVYAAGFHKPTTLSVGPDGALYVAQLTGEIIAISESGRRLYASDFTAPLGMAWRGDDLYVASSGKVSVVGADKRVRDIITGLPAARHQTDGLAFGRDGKLYIAQGSRSDHGELIGIDPMEAAVLVADPDGKNLRVFAKGLRNPFRIAFHPETGELFATDNGRDVPGEGVPEELNLIVEGGHYGWPDCWGANKGPNCANTLAPLAEFQENSSADGMVFYTGSNFPAEYRHNLFITLYGANSGDPLIGRRVERVVLEKTANGYRSKVTTFASGFKNPLDIVQGKDEALYVADFGNGNIYRIAWRGN